MRELSLREALPRRRGRDWLPWLALLAVACSRSGTTAPPPPPPSVVVSADIGPAGGILTIAEGPNAGVTLVIPAGAVSQSTRFSITPEVGNPDVLSFFPVYRFEPRDLDLSAVPATVIVRAGEALFDTGGSDAVCFTQSSPGAPWHALLASTLDPVARTMTTPASRLGDFVAWNGGLHRLFTQDLKLLDPAVPEPVDNLAGVAVTIANGTFSLQVGRGSLAAFWNATGSENVLIVHGLIGSPLDFLGAEDLIASLPPSVQNIVLVAYPSGPGVALTANGLYNEIVRDRGPGFRCSIIGHSLGGLVARYLIERSADDPLRSGYRPEDTPLDTSIAQLILLGVPNAGSELGNSLVSTLLPNIPADEVYLLQAAIDLSYRPDAITMQLNANYVDNATRYHVVYGDIGGGTDGVANVTSALALPLFGAETSRLFAVSHVELHGRALSSGITAYIHSLLQAP